MREQDLIDGGWERRSVACEPRLSEIVEAYEAIGFEVHLEPLPAREEMDAGACEGGCTVCFDADREKYRIVFTRRGGE
jgi:hypothetical protein